MPLTAPHVAGLNRLTPADGELVETRGYYTAGDGGAATYRYQANATNTADGAFILPGPLKGAKNVGRYFLIDQEEIYTQQLGCIPDFDTDKTDNLAKLQLGIDAMASKNIPLVINGRYKISDELSIDMSKFHHIRGQGDALVGLETAVNSKAAFVLDSPSLTRPSYRIIENLYVVANGADDNHGFRYTASGGASARGVEIEFRNVTVSCTGYGFHFPQMNYALYPAFRNVDVISGGGGLYIEPNASGSTPSHAVSGLRIDTFHFTGTSRTGTSLYLDRCRKTHASNVVLEAAKTFRADLSGFTGPADIHIKGAENGLLLEGLWLEAGGGSFPVGVTDSILCEGGTTHGNVKIVNPFVNKDLDITATGQMEVIIEDAFIELASTTDFTATGNAHITLDGCCFGSNAKAHDLTRKNRVTVRNCTVLDVKNPSNAGPVYKFDPTDEVVTLYEYTGGFLSNESQPLTWISTWGGAGRHHPQNDPVLGPTMLIESADAELDPFIWRNLVNNNYGIDLTQYEGKQLHWSVTYRVPHLDTNRTVQLKQQAVGENQVSPALTHASADAWKWKTHRGFMTIPASPNYTQLMDFAISGDCKWLQILHLSVSINGHPPAKARSRYARCLSSDQVTSATITNYGTWIIGDRVIKQSDVNEHWVCTTAGTGRGIASVTCDTTNSSTSITNIANITELIPGDYITIAGVTGTKRIMSLDAGANSAVIDVAADATTTTASVSASAAVFATVSQV